MVKERIIRFTEEQDRKMSLLVANTDRYASVNHFVRMAVVDRLEKEKK